MRTTRRMWTADSQNLLSFQGTVSSPFRRSSLPERFHGKGGNRRRGALLLPSSPRVFVSFLSLVLVLLSSPTRILTVQATILAGNASYPSLPALFGRFMMPGQPYVARLQFLFEAPYLCEPIRDITTSSFVPPLSPPLNNNPPAVIPLSSSSTTDTNSTYFPSSTASSSSTPETDSQHLMEEPVALLVARGFCSFETKAQVAQDIHPSVQFMIVYNYDTSTAEPDHHHHQDSTAPSDEDSMVPMYSEYGNTRLVLLSVSHATGEELKRYVDRANEPERLSGGPWIILDAEPPPGVLSAQDMQQMLLSAVALFFMLISCSGCLLLVLGSYGHWEGDRFILHTHHHHPQHHPTRRTPVVLGGSGSLLTETQVRKLAALMSSSSSIPQPTGTHHDNDASGENLSDAASSAPNFTSEEYHSCAICIDEFVSAEPGQETEETLTLPCHHRFHLSCIVPWLTERQSKCPLCKYDVLNYVLEHEDQLNDQTKNEGTEESTTDSPTSSPSSRSWSWSPRRWTRRRWSRVGQQDEHQHGEEEGPPDDGILMTNLPITGASASTNRSRPLAEEGLSHTRSPLEDGDGRTWA